MTKVDIDAVNEYKLGELLHWCDQNVAARGDILNKSWDWDFNALGAGLFDMYFSFSDPKMATMFSLRWL